MRDYQLIRVGSTWHLTQQQARPPARSELACHTSCGRWAEMKDGFERGRPDCTACLEHVAYFEKRKYGAYSVWQRLRGGRRRRALL